MGTPYTILVTGQSNAYLTDPLAWAPNARAKEWNRTPNIENSVGSAYAALSGSVGGIGACYASFVADADPAKDVYLMRFARNGKDILYWVGGGRWEYGSSALGGAVLNGPPTTATVLTINNTDSLNIYRPNNGSELVPGEYLRIRTFTTEFTYLITGVTTYTASTVTIPVAYVAGSGTLSGLVQIEHTPRFFTSMDLSVPSALAAAGKSTVDLVIWWQGESDSQYNSNYEAEFESAMGVFPTKSWWSPNTKVLICGISPSSISGFPTSDTFNSRLAALAAADSRRYFGNIGANVLPSRWKDVFHMTGQGYYDAAAYLMSVYAPPTVGGGTSGGFNVRNPGNSGWINAATAPGFRFRNASDTGWINKTSNMAGVAVRNAANTAWITFTGGGIGYGIAPTAGTVSEGNPVTFNVTTTGFGSGTLYWTNSGTTTGADFTDGQNSGSVAITANAGSFTRTLAADGVAEGGETIVMQLRTGSVAGPVVATASAVIVTDPPVTQLTLAQNDLDFYFLGTGTSVSPTAYMDFRIALDTTNLFNQAVGSFDHIAIALDCNGTSGGNNPHCGPIYRRGQSIWVNARGFIITRSGAVMAEHWNGTFSPGLLNITNTTGGTFNPLATPVFTVRILAGYRTGAWAEQMYIQIRLGTSGVGTLLFNGTAPGWGWDWTGSHKVALAAIASGSRSPNDTGCVEDLSPRNAPGAVLPFSGFELTLQS